MSLKMKDSKGELVDAQQLSFKPVAEPLTEYELEDGNKITIRIVLAEVYRLATPSNDLSGKNEYFIKTSPIISIIPKKTQG